MLPMLQNLGGPEYYHQAHKQFHPTYRAILYERNYYDIFIFDLGGGRHLHAEDLSLSFDSVLTNICWLISCWR